MEAGQEGTGGTGEGSGRRWQGQEDGGGGLLFRCSPQRRIGLGMSGPPLLGWALPQQWGNSPGGNGPGEWGQLVSVRVG